MTNYQELYDKMCAAGDAASNAIPDTGCVGFSYVIVRPANCAFAQWLKKQGIGSYMGKGTFWSGWWISPLCSQQSLGARSAWVNAAEKVLDEAGVRCLAYSRAD